MANGSAELFASFTVDHVLDLFARFELRSWYENLKAVFTVRYGKVNLKGVFIVPGFWFDEVNKEIVIEYPVILVDSLDIYSKAMAEFTRQRFIDDDLPIEASGKILIRPGVYSDIIYRLINNWFIKPWSGDYQLVIEGTLVTTQATRFSLPDTPGRIETIVEVTSQGIISYPDQALSSTEITQIAYEVWSQENRGSKVDLIPQMQLDIDAIRDVTRGRWLVKNNQMRFYDEDMPQSNLVAVFNLYDQAGVPAEAGVVERRPTDFQSTVEVFAKFVVNP